MNLQRLFWAALLVFLCLEGCRALPPAPPPVAVTSPEEILSRLRNRQKGLNSFQAKGRLTFLSSGQNYSGTALMAGRLPDHLKVIILDPLGRTILSFASNGVQVQVYSPREGKVFYGPASPKNLAALIPPTVSLPQTVNLMVGALPLSQGPPQSLAFESAMGRYRLEWRQDGVLKERLWVEAQNLYPVQEEWFGGATEPLFTAELGSFGALVFDLPGKVTLKTAQPKMELRLAYSELRPNPGLAADEFTLQPPPGVAVVPLGAAEK